MIDHLWTILCSRCIIEADTNSISLIEVLENVTVSAGGQPRFFEANWTLVTHWRRQGESLPNRGRARVELIAPNGDSVGPIPVEYEIDLSNTERMRALVHIPFLPDCGNGLYRFRISLEAEGSPTWRDVFNYPIGITFQSPAVADG